MSTECQPETDGIWGIEWQLTAAGSVAESQCPGTTGDII